jgi:hypothetical protein
MWIGHKTSARERIRHGSRERIHAGLTEAFIASGGRRSAGYLRGICDLYNQRK